MFLWWMIDCPKYERVGNAVSCKHMFSILAYHLEWKHNTFTCVMCQPICQYIVYGHVVSMMTSLNESIFCVTGPLCGEFTGHKGQCRGALIFPLICAWTSVWVNNGNASDLRRHRAHYDVTVSCVCVSLDIYKQEIELLTERANARMQCPLCKHTRD